MNVVSASLYKRTCNACDKPLFVFCLEMGIFSFVIPVPCDKDGDGTISLRVDAEYAILDFNEYKEVETMTFSAKCQEFPKEKLSELADELRGMKLLRSSTEEKNKESS